MAIEPLPLPLAKPEADKFVEDMFDHARELLIVLRDAGDDNGIKERITCLKYLEEIAKTYFILKKASTHDPDAAGSTVRKYATAFAKDAARGGAPGRKRTTKPAANVTPFDIGGLDTGSDDDAA